jgi:hypothetical protein
MIISEECGICRGQISIQDAASAEQVMITLDFFRAAHQHMPALEVAETPQKGVEPFGFSKSGDGDAGEPCPCGSPTCPLNGKTPLERENAVRDARLTEKAIEVLKNR